MVEKNALGAMNGMPALGAVYGTTEEASLDEACVLQQTLGCPRLETFDERRITKCGADGAANATESNAND